MSLLDGITAAEGWTIAKVEIETDGTRIEIPAPYKYTPAEFCTIRIIITVTDGTKTAEFSSDELTIKPMEYKAVDIAVANIFETTGWNGYKTKLDYSGNNCNTWYEFYEDM